MFYNTQRNTVVSRNTTNMQFSREGFPFPSAFPCTRNSNGERRDENCIKRMMNDAHAPLTSNNVVVNRQQRAFKRADEQVW